VQKGQEIVKDRMKDLIKNAISTFARSNEGDMPTNFVIYRDGVGDSQRQQVLDQEIPQFHRAITDLYKEKSSPSITVVIVNKRITQRFFVDNNGRYENPPSGCIIDKSLIEQDGTPENPGVFDFYLTPAKTTQGCVRPTHFYCALNDSKFSKLDIEHLTFALCHFYFNWAGPIKVPAPCQYGHKIAEFYTNVGLAKHD
jgi:aubergine